MTASGSTGSDPELVVVCGLPGVGKTTVAEHVAERTGGRLLRTDVVRKEVHRDPEYTRSETRAVYRELLDRAREAIEAGQTAVLDGTFRRRTYRERARALATDLGVGFELLKVECGTDRVADRIDRRDGDASDADFGVHVQLREAFEPVRMDHRRVDNSGSLAATRQQVDERF